MKRPSGLWILLSAGVLWLSIQDVYGVRGTSLIFGKSTTTTTTTPSTEEKESSEEEVVTTEVNADGNSTKPTLTGNPQIDYIWDPNLPKELNGYNLSDYPFYERVPKDINFKCDGLHDGFYASVQHKCQVYHHCLNEMRYDFLCGNYTAFDQRTFICHFASEVDCNNSKKFWHRNDALYKAASTTTIKPIIYTTAPPIQPTPAVLAPPVGSGQRRIRPYRRRRPQYDYYDDYYDDFYEDRPRSRGRNRPRSRPRPIYDDEYDEEYEEERFEKRGVGRRNEKRRPYERRPGGGRGRNKGRTRSEYEDEDSEEKYEENIELKKRKPVGSKESTNKSYGRRHPIESGSEEQEEKPRRFSTEKNLEKSKTSSDSRAIIKPVSGTIYDRPRLAPKIRLPVPKNEAKKYAYKPVTPIEPVSQENIEYDYDYEVDASNYDKKRHHDKSNTEPVEKSSSRPILQSAQGTSRTISRKRPAKSEYEDYEDDYEYAIHSRLKTKETSVKSSTKTPTTTSTTTTTTTTTTTSTTMMPIEKIEQPLIRLVKRPFLPSRGGNPYSARGLKPVGTKAVQDTRDHSEVSNDRVNYRGEFRPSSDVVLDSPVNSRFIPASPTESYQGGIDSRQNYQKLKVVQTQPSKLPIKNPLDIAVDEYDITLNDALNPTLPNLPVRGFPTGFDIVSNEYIYNNNYRPRYSQDQAVATASTGYVYKPKPADQRFEVQPQSDFGTQPIRGNVNYKAQYSPVYHNCLFGVRYDFLCANYTAFDQTLFNCNFVSNVDCQNSKKHWYRNDDLYKAASTTPAPVPYNFYTQAPPAYPLTASPSLRSPQGNYFSRRLPPVQQLPADQLIPLPGPVESPIEQRPQPRPQEHLRPRLDYYDIDDYEERPRVMYRRKRPRPRPVYYDDYDYYDERPYRRTEGRRRRPYVRRPMTPMKRNQGKRVKYDYEDDEIADDRTEEEDDRFVDDVPEGIRKNVRKEERPLSNRRKQPSRYKRPIEDDLDDYEEDYGVKEKRRRPASQTADYDDEPQVATAKRKGTKSDNTRKYAEESRVMIKPKTGTLYDRPRVAPRINLPVPKNVAKKYAYKSDESDTLYDEEISVSSSSERITTTTEPPQESSTARKRPLNPRRNNNRHRSGSNNEEKAIRPSAGDDDDEEIQERRADMKQMPVIVQSPSDALTGDCSRNCRGGNRSSQGVLRTKSNPQKTRRKVFRTLVSNRNTNDSEKEQLDNEKIIDIDTLYGTYDASLNEA